jgi:NADPH2:quinone reductase
VVAPDTSNPCSIPQKANALIDYRNGVEAMKAAVTEKLNGLECFHAIDSISGKVSAGGSGTWVTISQMLAPSTATQKSYLSVFSGSCTYDEPEMQQNIEVAYTFVGTAHSGAYRPGMPRLPADIEILKDDPEWAYVIFRYVAKMMMDGRLIGHPYKVVDGGLEGVEKGLRMLKEGKAKGVKFIYQIGKE